MKIKYKLLAFVPLFMLTGCGKSHEYKNVVKDIKDTGNTKMFIVNDVNDNRERIVILDLYYYGGFAKDFKYVQIGDTVRVVTDAMCKEDYYKDRLTLASPFVGISVNYDSINARKQREEFEKQKQNMMGGDCR